MYTVYILIDETGKIYKGFTNNLERRYKEHQHGHTRTTRKMQNLKILFREELSTREEARKREKYFKSAAGRRWLKQNQIVK